MASPTQWTSVQFSSVSVVSDSLRPHESQASLSITNSRSSLRLTSIESVMPSSQPSHPLSSPSPPAPNPSQHQSLFHESPLRMRCPKYWSFSFSIIPSKETPGLISFRMDWLDLLAIQGTLKSLLQHHSSKASELTEYQNGSLFHTLVSWHVFKVALTFYYLKIQVLKN